MAFKKDKVYEKNGIVANFHTITFFHANFRRQPTFDENGTIIDPGPMSTIILSHFASEEFHNEVKGDADRAIFETAYDIDIFIVSESLRVPDGLKSAETKAYEQILLQDPFWADAEIVN